MRTNSVPKHSRDHADLEHAWGGP